MMMGSNSFKVLCNYATPESFMRLEISLNLFIYLIDLCLDILLFIAAVMFKCTSFYARCK